MTESTNRVLLLCVFQNWADGLAGCLKIRGLNDFAKHPRNIPRGKKSTFHYKVVSANEFILSVAISSLKIEVVFTMTQYWLATKLMGDTSEVHLGQILDGMLTCGLLSAVPETYVPMATQTPLAILFPDKRMPVEGQ